MKWVPNDNLAGRLNTTPRPRIPKAVDRSITDPENRLNVKYTRRIHTKLPTIPMKLNPH